MRRRLALLLTAAAVAAVTAWPAGASTPKGLLFHDGATVGTVITPVTFRAGASIPSTP